MPTSIVEILQPLDRIEHFDSDGGGTIMRTFYVEPYTSHKTLLTALKGTVYDGGDGVWRRLLPHADPLYPNFYCNDVKCIPMERKAIRGSYDPQFDAGKQDAVPVCNLQSTEIRRCLDNLDDFDLTNTPENIKGALTPAGILAGGFNPNTAAEGYRADGRCGAFVTATYNPLVIVGGTRSGSGFCGVGDGTGFDFVDPIRTPIVKSVQLGSDMLIYAGALPGVNVVCPGLSDTYSQPEVLWEFTCRRLLVPFLPELTFSAYPNRINAADWQVGTEYYNPGEVVRCEIPAPVKKVAPDGATYYDITLKFTIRTITADWWDHTNKLWVNPTSVPGQPAGYYRIGWNRQLCRPHILHAGLPLNSLGYYRVGTTVNGAAGVATQWREAYLTDAAIGAEQLPVGGTKTFNDMFTRGFKAGD